MHLKRLAGRATKGVQPGTAAKHANLPPARDWVPADRVDQVPADRVDHLSGKGHSVLVVPVRAPLQGVSCMSYSPKALGWNEPTGAVKRTHRWP